MKWQSISLCFVHSWKMGLTTMWRVAWLSQYKGIEVVTGTRKSCKSCLSQTSTLVVVAMTGYYTSAEEWETMVCFLECHKMGECPRKIIYLIVNCTSGGWTSCPVSIIISLEIQSTIKREENTLAVCAFNVS